MRGARLWELFRERGAFGIVAYVVLRAAKQLEQRGPRARRFRRELARRDANYDAANNVDTAGVLHLKKLSIAGSNRRFGTSYIATDPHEFARAVAALPVIRQEDFTFIDLGSGKGRALLLAADRQFRSVIGVEFASELHEIAQANLRNRPQVRLYCADVVEFEFPPEPLIVFMYNPFGPEVMTKVARRLRDSHSLHPRPIFVLYLNPFYMAPWRAEGFRTVRTGDPFVILTPGA